MRIGLVTGEYPPDQGGVGDFTSRLARALAHLGHEMHVITTARGEAQRATRHRLELSRSDSEDPLTVHFTVRSWRWGCWGQVMKLAQDLSLDTLNVQYQAAAYAVHPAISIVPRGAAMPSVAVTFHDLKVPYLFPKAGPLRWWALLLLARRADGVIVTNQEDYLRLQDEIDSDKLSLIPIGSNIPASPPAGYDRTAQRARWGIGRGDLLLGYFGFLNESKGGEELIQALGHLVEHGLSAHLLMIGGRVGSSDPTNRAYAKRVEQLIAARDLGNRIHWTGYTSPEQVSAALLAVDLCVLPYRDGVSFRRGTLMACLAHGCAIVSTYPAVPLPEVRDGETMVLVEPGNPSALAEAVSDLSANPSLRTRLREEARALAAEFSWERIARRTAGVLANLSPDSQ
jgi:glycosyltransferase involved in cell wall biosynthesis